ncbi:MAG: DUF4416 family protein [Desulfobacteraceae bacterium]|nr:MAG: DUF4416 family protein [Desulfobacteraceae bacterium]
MSLPQPPDPAKLVIGLFTREKQRFKEAAHALAEKFGEMEMVSPWFPFDYTSYYEAEMGGPLFRRMIVFKTRIRQADLPDIKAITNTIERQYTRDNKRLVNIDPGYLLLERFVLATGKNYTHRIYIGKGFYADLTLIFQNGSFQTLPWTYPDYADPTIKNFLEKIRNRLRVDGKGT